MKVNKKKIFSIALAVACLTSALSLSACGEKAWSVDTPLAYTPAEATTKATSNGGFAVEQDGYVYFINGSTAYDGDNTFGLFGILFQPLVYGSY